MATLTTGVFLAGYAVELGAAMPAIGMLAAGAVPYNSYNCVRRSGGATAQAACHPTWAAGIGGSLLIAPPPRHFSDRGGIIALIVSVALYQRWPPCRCAGTPGLRDLVPESEFGRFFGRRAAATTAVATALALVCGLLIDTWKRNAPAQSLFAYSTVFTRQRSARAYLACGCCRSLRSRRCLRLRAHAYSSLLAAPFRRSELPAADGLPLVVEFRANLAAPFSVPVRDWRLSLAIFSPSAFIRGGNGGPANPLQCAICCRGAPIDPQPVERCWSAPRGALPLWLAAPRSKRGRQLDRPAIAHGAARSIAGTSPRIGGSIPEM